MELFVQDHLWQFPLNIILVKRQHKITERDVYFSDHVYMVI